MIDEIDKKNIERELTIRSLKFKIGGTLSENDIHYLSTEGLEKLLREFESMV